MKKSCVISCAVAALGVGTGAFSAKADTLLGTYEVPITGTLPSVGSFEMRPYISYGSPDLPNPVGYMNNQAITFLEIANGIPLTLTGDFAAFAQRITNGDNDLIYLGATVTGGTGSAFERTDALVLDNAPRLNGAPDLDGYIFTRITVLGTSYQDNGMGDFESGLMFRFYGERVPAPGGLALLGVAGLAASRRRR